MVQFVAPTGQVFTTKDAGSDALDSDADTSTGRTPLFTLASGGSNLTLDAGLKPIDLSLTKTVDNSAPAVGTNVVFTVTLTNAAGLSQATGVTVTDLLPSGLTYFSSSATQGTYDSGTSVWTVGSVSAGSSPRLTITATVATAGTKTNYGQVTAANQPDRDSTPNNGVAPNVAEDDEAVASVTPPGTIGDYAWVDKNVNGVQDAGEPAVSGMTVRLLDSGGATVGTTTTNASGAYSFTAAPGTYMVEFVLPTGQVFTTKDQGGDDTKDSDADVATGRTALFTLASGASNLTLDAGLKPADLSLAKTVDNASPGGGQHRDVHADREQRHRVQPRQRHRGHGHRT